MRFLIENFGCQMNDLTSPRHPGESRDPASLSFGFSLFHGPRKTLDPGAKSRRNDGGRVVSRLVNYDFTVLGVKAVCGS